MAPLQVSWFVRMCVIVIEIQCVMQFVRQKLGNTHNSVNFYSNWKIDPSKPKISASLVQWSGSEITKKYTFWTEKWKNWASENGFLSLLDFENSLFWYRACEMCHRKVYFTCKVGGCNSDSSISNMKMLNILWKFLSKTPKNTGDKWKMGLVGSRNFLKIQRLFHLNFEVMVTSLTSHVKGLRGTPYSEFVFLKKNFLLIILE